MRPIVLFYTSEAGQDASHHAAVLAQHGYEVRHCPDTASLRLDTRQALDEAAQSGEPVLAVLAGAAPSNRAAASILAGLPQVGVLAQVDSCDNAALVATLQLGIDAWCPRECSSDVLVLVLHSLKRRLERGTVHLPAPPSRSTRPSLREMVEAARQQPASEGQWLLRELAWVLETPAGGQIRLTSSERNFMLKLAEQSDRAATHVELFQRHGQRPVDPQMAKQRLGVLVSRLRRKVACHGGELPIKSLHNWGYMFTDELAVVGAAPPASR